MHKKILYTFSALVSLVSVTPLSAMYNGWVQDKTSYNEEYEKQLALRLKKVEQQFREQDRLGERHGQVYSSLSEGIKEERDRLLPTARTIDSIIRNTQSIRYEPNFDDDSDMTTAQMHEWFYQDIGLPGLGEEGLNSSLQYLNGVNKAANEAKHPNPNKRVSKRK